MTSPNNVKRVKYENNRNDAFITLSEYIIFFGENKCDKYAVFKFKNELDQYLFGFQFELSQYNDVDNLIEKSTLTYKDIKINNLETFVPDKKIKLNEKCDHIEIEIVSASFERMNFAHGQTTEQKFDYKDYTNSLTEEKEEVKVVARKKKKENKKENKEYKQKKKASDLSTVKIRNVTKQNKSGRPWRFAITCSLILCVFMFLTADYQRKFVSELTVNDVYYKITSDEECIIEDYFGDATGLVINTRVTIQGKEYKVKKISANAFKGNKTLTVVTFTLSTGDTLEIQAGAFAKCEALVNVLSSTEHGTIKVASGAFTGSKNLKNVNMPNAIIANKAFTSQSLQTFKVKGVQTATKFYMLFDDATSNNDLTEINYEIKSASIGFFDVED